MTVDSEYGKGSCFSVFLQTVRTNHPFVKKLQDTAVILDVSRKEE